MASSVAIWMAAEQEDNLAFFSFLDSGFRQMQSSKVRRSKAGPIESQREMTIAAFVIGFEGVVPDRDRAASGEVGEVPLIGVAEVLLIIVAVMPGRSVFSARSWRIAPRLSW